MNNYDTNIIASLITENPHIFNEDYDRETDPGTRNFWGNIRNSRHPFSAHPILALYGSEIAKDAYGFNREMLINAFPQLRDAPASQLRNAMMETQRVFMNTTSIERMHKEELERLAVELVSKVWGAPPEIFDAKLAMPNDFAGGQEMEPGQQEVEPGQEGAEPVDIENVPVDREQVNKRITMNALSQGAAVHNMGTIHYVVEGELNEIDPRLLMLYKKLSSGSTYAYWLMNFANMTREMLSHAAVGSSKVQYGDNENEDIGQSDELDYGESDYELESPEEVTNARIIARGVNFPVLVQELVKGLMELLSHHGLENLDENQLASIYQEADRLEDEPWLIQIGPQLWRMFLRIVPKGHSLIDVVATLAAQEPKLIHKLLSDTIEMVRDSQDPTGPREVLLDLMMQLEEETPAQFDDEDYDELEDDDRWDVGEPTY